MRRAALMSLGWLAVALGVFGVFLPLLPTVPFLLLAAWSFSMSSPRLHGWLVAHPRLGPPLRDWQENGVIRPRAKRLATALIVISAAFPLYLTPLPVLLRLGVATTLCGVLAFIWTRPTAAPSQDSRRSRGENGRRG